MGSQEEIRGTNSGTHFIDYGLSGEVHGFVVEISMRLLAMMSMSVLVTDRSRK
jgi:hypothetical protein